MSDKRNVAERDGAMNGAKTTTGAEESDALHAYAVAQRAANKAWAKCKKANQEAAVADCAWEKACRETARARLAVFHAQRKHR